MKRNLPGNAFVAFVCFVGKPTDPVRIVVGIVLDWSER